MNGVTVGVPRLASRFKLARVSVCKAEDRVFLMWLSYTFGVGIPYVVALELDEGVSTFETSLFGETPEHKQDFLLSVGLFVLLKGDQACL